MPLLFFAPALLSLNLPRITSGPRELDRQPRFISGLGQRKSRVVAESDASELSVHPGHDKPSLRPRIGDAHSEGRQVSIVVLDLSGLRRLEACDGGDGKTELRHGLRLRSGYECTRYGLLSYVRF